MQKIDFQIQPGIGAAPIKFGMSPQEVHAALGMLPERTKRRTNGLREDFKEFGINYDESQKVAEICFSPQASVYFDGHELLEGNPNEELRKHDADPKEVYGFLVYQSIGVNTCGYHNGEDSQRALNVFRLGYWDEIIKA